MFSYKTFKDDYLFPFNNNNLLRLKAGSLKYDPTQRIQYEVTVTTLYLGVEYKQHVRIKIQNIDQMPIILIA